MGGVGKTELVLQYARQYFLERKQYQGGVCCLSARDVDLGTQVVQFGRIEMGLEPPDDFDLAEQVQWVWRRWQPEAGDVLVVLDDVVDYKAVEPYLTPDEPRFKTVITTRLQRLSPKFAALELKVLSLPESLRLLRSLVRDGRIDAEPEAAQQLCQELGCLPLGLELVGQYLVEAEDLSVPEMLAELQEEKLAHPGLEEPTAATTANQGVRAAFELSWRKLSTEAQALGCLLSVFALAPIPWELVDALNTTDAKKVRRVRDRELVKRSLLERDAPNTYRLHQLVREFLREKLDERDQPDVFRYNVANLLAHTADKMPQTLTLDDIEKFTPFLPHWQETIHSLTAYLEDKYLIQPFTALGIFHLSQGRYTVAEPWLDSGLKAVRQRLREDHPSIAITLNNLALLYREQGKYSQSEPLFLKALEMMRQDPNKDLVEVAKTLNNLARLYEAQGKYKQAKSLYFQALLGKQKALGDNHTLVAGTLNDLAGLYQTQGEYEQSENLYLQARSIWEEASIGDHPYMATILNNLATLYQTQGKYENSENLFCEVLRISRRAFGEDHPHVAAVLNNFSELCRLQEKYKQSESLCSEALAILVKSLADHPHTAKTLNNLALIYVAQRKYRQAESLYLRALIIYQKKLDEDHPDLAITLNNLAGLYEIKGEYGKAESLYLQALEMRREALGKEHPDVAASLNNLAELYRTQEKYEQAEPLYLQAIPMLFGCLGQEHPYSQGGFKNFVVCLTAAHQANLAHTLSDHPLTQSLLQQIRDNEP